MYSNSKFPESPVDDKSSLDGKIRRPTVAKPLPEQKDDYFTVALYEPLGRRLLTIYLSE